jgi:hypothetical protein
VITIIAPPGRVGGITDASPRETEKKNERNYPYIHKYLLGSTIAGI